MFVTWLCMPWLVLNSKLRKYVSDLIASGTASCFHIVTDTAISRKVACGCSYVRYFTSIALTLIEASFDNITVTWLMLSVKYMATDRESKNTALVLKAC